MIKALPYKVIGSMEAKICFPFKWINGAEVRDVGVQGLIVIYSYQNDDLISW